MDVVATSTKVRARKPRSDRLSQDEFIRRLKVVAAGRYTTDTAVYQGTKAKVEVTCTKCGVSWSTQAKNLLAGSSCPKCVTMSQCEFISKLHEAAPGLYLTDKIKYVNYRTPVTVVCAMCRHEWSNTPAKLLFYKNKCKYCFGSGLKTTDMFVAQLQEKYPGVFDASRVSYVTTDTKVQIGCLKCQGWWHASPAKLLSGRGCPRCKSSAGEKAIEKWLIEAAIPYVREHRFSECKDKKPLPFDFYLPSAGIAIEYDGIQHFSDDGQGKNGKRWGSHDLDGVRRRDAIKDKFCADNGIKLVRIKYTDKNMIGKILDAEVRYDINPR